MDAPGRADQEQQVEERHVGQVAAEQAAHGTLEEVACDRGTDPRALEEPGHRAGVPLLCALRRPRRLDREAPGHAIELGLRENDRENGEWTDPGDQPVIPPCPTLTYEEMSAGDERLVRRHTHFSRQRMGRLVSVREPCAATVDGGAVGQFVRPDTASDAIARLKDGDQLTSLRQATGCREAGIPGPNDTYVHFDLLRHRELGRAAG